MNDKARQHRRALIFWGCVIAGLVFASQFVGCAPPVQPDYLPTLAVAAAVADVDDVPTPSDECKNCNGLGYLGDGTVKVDCPECDLDPLGTNAPQKSTSGGHWNVDSDIQRLISIIEQLDARLTELERRLDDLEIESPRPAGNSNVVPQREAAGGASNARTPDSAATRSSGSQGVGAQAKSAPASSIEWVSLQEAQADPRPVMLYFSTTNCTYCRWMEANVFTDPAVIQASKRWACVKVGPSIASRYGITLYPSFVFHTGPRSWTRVVGRQYPAQFLSQLRAAQ